VVADEVTSPALINGIFPILGKWEQSDEEERVNAELDNIVPTTKIPMNEPTAIRERRDT
jgi:hypothetical protein